MQDIIKILEERLQENPNAIKTYKNYSLASATANGKSEELRKMYKADIPCRFIVVCIPSTKRWTPIFLLSDFLNANHTSGYLGFFAQQGFFSI